MRNTQPAVEHGRVNASEVDGVARIAVVKMSEIRVGAVQAGFHGTAEQEDRRGRAMVRAAAAVFTQATAELGEDEDQYAVGFARFLQVVQERRERCPELTKEACVLLELSAVGVETVQVGVIDRGRQAALDQLGDQAQAPGQAIEVGVA